jgi:uncharacterized protein YhbP (UPF0306 family)
MNRDELEQKISRYLQEHSICTLATVLDGKPHASALEYVNFGLRIYIVSIPGTAKVQALAKNPDVAITVNESYLDMRGVQGVQYWGAASVVTDDQKKERIRTLFFDKFTVFRLIHWRSSKAMFYEINPARVDFIDYRREFGYKEKWLAE